MHTCSCILAREAGISQSKVMNALHENLHHTYHFKPIQELCRPDFQKRVTFCRWLLKRDIEEYHFFRRILWADQSLFTRDDMLNLHNMFHYAVCNMKLIIPDEIQLKCLACCGWQLLDSSTSVPGSFQKRYIFALSGISSTGIT